MKAKYPKPYAPLTRNERTIYDRLWKRVEEYIGIDDADNFVITLAAQHLNMAHEALKRIREENGGLPMQTFENGTRQVSPDYTVYKAMSDQGLKMLEKSGVLPKARKDLGVFDEVEEDVTDPILMILGNSKKKAN